MNSIQNTTQKLFYTTKAPSHLPYYPLLLLEMPQWPCRFYPYFLGMPADSTLLARSDPICNHFENNTSPIKHMGMSISVSQFSRFCQGDLHPFGHPLLLYNARKAIVFKWKSEALPYPFGNISLTQLFLFIKQPTFPEAVLKKLGRYGDFWINSESTVDDQTIDS